MSFTSVVDSTEIGQERKKDKRKNKMGKKSKKHLCFRYKIIQTR